MVVPIVKLLRNKAFDAEATRVLSSAFDTAWRLLEASGSLLATEPEAASTRESLAKRIIEMRLRGERDPNRLVDGALAYLTNADTQKQA